MILDCTFENIWKACSLGGKLVHAMGLWSVDFENILALNSVVSMLALLLVLGVMLECCYVLIVLLNWCDVLGVF